MNVKERKITWFLLLIGILGRLVPHLPNVTPCLNISWFAGNKLPPKIALPLIGILFLVSDWLLSLIYGYPFLGMWSLFTYSGFLLITWVGKFFSPSKKVHKFFFLLGCSFGFWIWSNFWVWMEGIQYSLNWLGLVDCYYAALPFLRNEILGDGIWFVIIFGSFEFLSRRNLNFPKIFSKIKL